jgi:hypothetical protein
MASSLLTGLVPSSAAQRAVMGIVSFSSRTAFCGSRLHNLKLVGNNVSRSGKGRGNALGCRAALAVGRGERRGSGEDWMFDPLELGNNNDASLPNFWGAIESSVLQQSRSGSGRSSGSSSSKGAAGAYNCLMEFNFTVHIGLNFTLPLEIRSSNSRQGYIHCRESDDEVSRNGCPRRFLWMAHGHMAFCSNFCLLLFVLR